MTAAVPRRPCAKSSSAWWRGLATGFAAARGPRAESARGPRAAANPVANPRHHADELWAHGRRGTAAVIPLFQIRPVEDSRAARTQADVRNLHLLASL